MKHIFLSLLFVPTLAFSQNSRLEIGLSGGVHLHSTPRLSTLESVNPAGTISVNYSFAPKWKLGIEIGVLSASFLALKDLSPTTDVRYHFASPLVASKATITRIIRDRKWQTCITAKAGFTKAFEKKSGLDSTSTIVEVTYPEGSGLAIGIAIAHSKMISKRVGFTSSIGLDYYQISYPRHTIYYFGGGKSNFLSLPFQIGAFLKI